MYLVVIQSTVMALLGGRLRWQRMIRTGAATAHARESSAPAVPRARQPRHDGAAVTGSRWPVN